MIEVSTAQELGLALKREAERKRISQRKLAKITDFSHYKVIQIFKGRENVPITDYSKMALILGFHLKFTIKPSRGGENEQPRK